MKMPRAALVVLTLIPLAPAGTEPVASWIRSHAIPIQTVEPGSGFADLNPVAGIVGNATIVGLGEATHGTREFFQLKHRLIEYLVNEEGFNVFAIEANMPEAQRLNDFVLKGQGDPGKLLKGLYFWTWDTQEVLDMILWMRDYNAAGHGRIEFTGFDMQEPGVATANVAAFVAKNDPDWSKELARLYRNVSNVKEPVQPTFGVATTSLPLRVAAGKHVVFSGFIKTQAITQGYAGLWLRVDGKEPGRPLAFDNMQSRGARETTAWTRYEIAVDVPADATNINLGALHPGTGTAWFDSLQITIDGKPWQNPETMDPDFEAPSAFGFYTGGEGYQVDVDPREAHTGKQSLRIAAAVPARRNGLLPSADPNQVLENCAAVFEHLQASRIGYLNANPKDIDWAIQNARLVWQLAALKTGEQTRDQSMAENIVWIAAQAPKRKVIVWAHNGHVAYGGYAGLDSMGGYLRETFGDRYMNFGFAFGQGAFRAVDPGKGLREFQVGPAPEGSLDSALLASGMPLLAIDLRNAPRYGADGEWFTTPHLTRTVGAVYSETNPAQSLHEMRAAEAFDALLFVQKTTASRVNGK
jgi:erythromycin esterase-like protein